MATASSSIFGGIQLSLSDGEAKTLAAISYRIGGSPDNSPRKHTETVGEALRRAGYAGSADTPERKALSGSLMFENYQPVFVAGAAYKDGDGDVFIRTVDNRWIDHYGHKQADRYPTQPVKKLN
jgi:hypothetical protein